MRIDGAVLREIRKHDQRLGLRHRIKGLAYERCAEIPFIVQQLQGRFGQRLKHLDIGSGGDSPLPTFLLRHSNWDVSCVDKCDWVDWQHRHAQKVMRGKPYKDRFRVIREDFLATALPAESFDVITNISVVEHFEGHLDVEAMRASARLLRPGGVYILTTPVNEGHFREFYVGKNVYGDRYQGEPVFYQRHYDLKSLDQRVIHPSGLRERQRVFFGDYGFQCFENLFQKPPRLIRTLYRWAQPHFARRYLTYNEFPASRENMRTNTASGVIVIMEKPLATKGTTG
ncbi:MAG: class I SAM-dependent methyltransferase [Pirellulales bacterium]|nr:class I SAM-dependent methyltransferase [Pirellulales bacterium]